MANLSSEGTDRRTDENRRIMQQRQQAEDDEFQRIRSADEAVRSRKQMTNSEEMNVGIEKERQRQEALRTKSPMTMTDQEYNEAVELGYISKAPKFGNKSVGKSSYERYLEKQRNLEKQKPTTINRSQGRVLSDEEIRLREGPKKISQMSEEELNEAIQKGLVSRPPRNYGGSRKRSRRSRGRKSRAKKGKRSVRRSRR